MDIIFSLIISRYIFSKEIGKGFRKKNSRALNERISYRKIIHTWFDSLKDLLLDRLLVAKLNGFAVVGGFFDLFCFCTSGVDWVSLVGTFWGLSALFNLFFNLGLDLVGILGDKFCFWFDPFGLVIFDALPWLELVEAKVLFGVLWSVESWNGFGWVRASFRGAGSKEMRL